MARRPPRTDTGRRSILTTKRVDRMIAKVRAGNYLATVAQSEGIARETLFQWLQQGQAVIHALDHPNPTERKTAKDFAPQALVYASFADGVARARAEAEEAAVSIVQDVMRGGFLLEEEPVVSKSGDIVLDPKTGEPLMKRKWAPPDGKLAMAYLGATGPDRWRPNTPRIELTTVEGLAEARSTAATEDGVDDSAAGQLAVRLAEHLRAHQAELESGSEDVVEGEVIDE